MLVFAVAFLTGHCAVHAAPSLPDLWPWAIAPIAVSTVAGVLRIRWLVALCLGVVWAWSHAAWRLGDQLPAEVMTLDTQVQGHIASLVKVDDAVRFALDVRHSDARVPTRIELTWYDTQVRPAPGELWQLRVRIKPPRGFANPGGSDYAGQLFRDGVGATGYVRDTKIDRDSNRRLRSPSLRYAVLRARALLAERIEAALPHSRMLGIVQGLAVGATDRIDSDQWRVFAQTGTTHLMAISGLHIGMVAALAAWLGGAVARRWRWRSQRLAIVDVQAICGMSAALIYSALAGFSVPTQRTLIMLLVYFGTRCARRHVTVTQGLSLALVAVLCIDPFAPLAPGFWLSFGAVGAIFLATSGRLRRPHWAASYFQLQGVVSIGLLPLLIGAFGAVSVISPPVNLLAIPFFTFVVVPLVLLGALAVMLNAALGHAVLQAPAWLLEQVWPWLELVSQSQWAAWYVPQLPEWMALMLTVGCVLAIAPGVLAMRLAGLMLCVPAFLWSPARPAPGEFELAALDVGQGLAVVVRTQSHTLLYDTGPSFRSGRDTGEMVVLPYLRSVGVRRLDLLVLSHGDDDHVGGASSILTAMPTRTLSGPSVLGHEFESRCEQGQHWSWDDVAFTVLHPSSDEAGGENNSSCVLRIDGQFGSALITGDIEREAERALLSGGLRVTDVVLVPHHGSRTSSTHDFATALAPRLAIVSAGHGNRWGFPKEDVVERWEMSGARVLTTAQSGAVEVAVSRGSMQAPREFRRVSRAYWRDQRASAEDRPEDQDPRQNW